ncbi:MAG: serine/threonine-protein kinase [Myxococcales bacterium]|nr:serine/threonine-protein kinase [Myxococcales bacterium]
MADLVFGKYEVQHRLAIGGMGEVFYALQRGVAGFERPVILKSLLPELAQQEGFIDQFLDEARVAATLNHPNVVSIFEVGQWNGTYYLAMEYIRGRNLAQIIRKALEQQVHVPPLVSVRIVRDAALGLDHAHRATDGAGNPLNIVHRDISPQNIMVRDDGLTKVVDFGIARASNRATRTATGALKGKVAYMAPEQVLGGDVGARADQFALGVVLWELLTHRRLFKAERDLDVVRKVLEEPIAPPSSVRPLPPDLDAVTMRMLNRDASHRFASCADAAKALDLIASRQVGGDLSPADFMRQLGTDDLVVKTRTTPQSAGNFVISLKAPSAGSSHVSTVGASGASGRSGRPWVLGAAVVAVLVIAGGLILGGRASPGEMESLPPVVVTPLEPPPPPPPVVVAPIVAPPPVVAEPVLAVATLSIETTPSRATLRVDGKPVGTTPHELELTAGHAHYVLVEKAGYRRIEQEVTLEPGVPKSLVLKLEPLDTKRPPAPQPVVVAAPSAPGFLTVNTVPWTKVAVDGEPIGSIPIASKKLTPGRHQLELVNEGAGISDKRFIDIKSGETLKLNLTLK